MRKEKLFPIIAQAKEQKREELNLSGKDLMCLPTEIGQLTNLKRLSLYK